MLNSFTQYHIGCMILDVLSSIYSGNSVTSVTQSLFSGRVRGGVRVSVCNTM
jgi:hypothetical protein